jgi:aminotransferase
MNFSLSHKMGMIDSSPIRKAFELAATIQDPINLSIGQPHFPCPPNIVEALNKAAMDGKTSYTLSGGIPELKNALTKKYEEFNGIDYATPERLLITSGISSALFLLFNALVDPGDTCLIISPYFLMYPSMLKFYGAEIELLKEDFSTEDILPLKKKKFKLIIYSNPSNPSGYIFSKEQLENLVELAEATGAYLISDEIYEMFDYDKKFISVGKFYDKTITLSGFSKSFNMTGLRLASVVSPIEINKALTTLQQYTVVCAPSTTQYAGLEALKTDMKPYIDDYREKRDYVYTHLNGYYKLNKSAGAFYYFIQINGNDEDFIKRAVTEKKLILVPGFIFHPTHSYIRISFASTWENLKKGVLALQELSQ